MSDVDVLRRALDRERRARREAEQLLEHKSVELYQVNEELRSSAAALKSHAERTQSILDAAADGIITVDADGRIELFNAAAGKLFGYSAIDVVGMQLAELPLTADDERRTPDSLLALSLPAEVLSECRELLGRRKDGTTFKMELTCSRVHLDRELFTFIVRDITERKRLERQLSHAQKMESVGQLAAGIAHELNTPIQYVAHNTQFLQQKFETLLNVISAYGRLEAACRSDADSLQQSLELIRETSEAADLEFLKEQIPRAIAQTLEGTRRVARIVSAMREFSHPGGNEKQPTNLNEAIRNTITVSRNEWKYVADLQPDLDPALPPVRCLSNELNQAILNLIVNAAHAISDVVGPEPSEKGVIIVRTRAHTDCVEISVTDTGAGIPDSVRGRIFDPFFTTKAPGFGTGQGLAIVYSVVIEKHNGSIHIDTFEGEGTTFTLRLPLNEFIGDSGVLTYEEQPAVCR